MSQNTIVRMPSCVLLWRLTVADASLCDSCIICYQISFRSIAAVWLDGHAHGHWRQKLNARVSRFQCDSSRVQGRPNLTDASSGMQNTVVIASSVIPRAGNDASRGFLHSLGIPETSSRVYMMPVRSANIACGGFH